VAYIKPGVVEVQSIDFPKLSLGQRKCEHGVILKIVSTNICGSDQHMVRGRTTAPKGIILGHEITGEVIEAGRDVEFIKKGDLVCLSDILPTGYHGAVSAGVGVGSTVYVAGAGPVGLACAAACHLLGAAVVIVGDLIPERLAQARSFGCETGHLAKGKRGGAD